MTKGQLKALHAAHARLLSIYQVQNAGHLLLKCHLENLTDMFEKKLRVVQKGYGMKFTKMQMIAFLILWKHIQPNDFEAFIIQMVKDQFHKIGIEQVFQTT